MHGGMTCVRDVEICLLGGIFVGGALLVSMGMAAMFSFVIGWALYQRLDIGCGCFGSGTDKITYLTLIRELIILLFSAAAYVGVIVSSRQARRSEAGGKTDRSMPAAEIPADGTAALG